MTHRDEGDSPAPGDVAAASPPTSAHLVGRRAGRGAVSVLVVSGLVNAIQIVSSLVLARNLLPAEYGAFAVAATVVGFGRFLGDCGAGSAVIQQPGKTEPDRRELGRALFLQFAVAGTAGAGLFLAAPAIRAAFEAPAETTFIIRVLALTLLIEVPAVVGKVRLNRAQRYQWLQVVYLVWALALYAVQIGGLLAGYGLNALVAGQVVSSVTSTLLFLVAGGLVAPRVRGALRLARRGLPYQGALAIQAFFAIASLGVVGTQLSTAQLGLWTWCTVLATPLLGLATNLQHLAFPALSRLHEHHADRHGAAVSMVARLEFSPVAAAVGVLCGLTVPLIRHAFDDRWLGAVDAARAALLGVLPFLLAALLAASAQAAGRPGLRLRAMGPSTLVGVVAAVPLSAWYGPTGAAIAIYLVVPLVDAAILVRLLRADIRRAVANAAVIGGGSFAVALLLSPYAEGVASLMAVGAVAGVAGLGLMLLVDLPVLRTGWRIVRPSGGS